MLSLGMLNKGIWCYKTVEFYVSASVTNQDAHNHICSFRIQGIELLEQNASTDGRYVRSNAQHSANKIFIAVLSHLINLYIDHI